MSLDLFETIVQKIIPYKPLVAINMGGESTLHPKLPYMIQRLHRAGSYVFLDTNATMITESLASQLLECGLDELVLCFDGNGTTDSYEHIRVGANYAKTLANVRSLLAMRQKATFSTTRIVIKNIQYYQADQQLQTAVPIKHLFADNPPDEYRATWADYWPGSHRDNLKEEYSVKTFSSQKYTACTNLWKKMAISWDGQVYACCLDLNRTHLIGNLGDMDLFEVWNAPEMIKLRTKHARNEQASISLCQSCTMIQRTPSNPLSGIMNLRNERFTQWSKEVTNQQQGSKKS
jgi:radical SAM protein with 4Fe4S-binding SPASM domain